MMSYEIMSLSEFMTLFPQEHVSDVLHTFSCKRDKDVESFLREKAIVQEKKQTSRTYLMFTARQRPELAAYFSLAVSSMDVKGLECSNELRKKMNINNDIAQSYLIGQIGKCDGSEKGLGTLAILHAISLIRAANTKVGCRLIRLDCKPSLIKYYTDNGFIHTGRNTDGDLHQMVRIIDPRTAPPSS